ncbi:MAG: hypothetical protein ACXW2Q_02465 [Thermoanaerobaculia bacterium]
MRSSFQQPASLLAVLLLAACGMRDPIRNTMTIEPDDDRRRVTVSMRIEIGPDTEDRSENGRLAEARASIVNGRDPWTARFASLNAESARVIYEKSYGTLRRAEWSAKIPTEDLQRFLAETGTVQMTDGERWTELAFYPTASTRATRQQREHVLAAMRTWATDAVQYFRALDRLYSYLDRQPHRATPVFTILLSDQEQISTIEEEDALIKAVTEAMGAIIDHVNQAKQQGMTLDEEFDLVFNPLPAEIVLHLPAPIISSDGFERRDERTVAIPRAGLIDAIASLEGRWATPDPLAIIARASDTNSNGPTAEDVAAIKRHSTPAVTVDEVEKALAARLRPAGAYRVRW